VVSIKYSPRLVSRYFHGHFFIHASFHQILELLNDGNRE
jgi:hypothetical protein